MQQSTVINFRLANCLCQVIMYSYLPKETEIGELSETLSLKAFSISEEESKRDLLYDMIQFIALNYQYEVQDLASKKNDQLIKKLRAILSTITEVSSSNLREMLPILLKFVTACDYEIPKLVQAESIHDLRAVNLQENVNTVLKKLLKSWFNNISDEENKQEEVFQFLSNTKGLQFLMARIQNLSAENPYFVSPIDQISEKQNSKDYSSDESMEEDNDFNQNVLKFVGSRIGLRLTKNSSISTSLVLNKTDHELFKPAKVVTQMRKQTAIYNKSPTKDLSMSPFSRTKARMQLQENDLETMQSLKSLMEKNFATSLSLVDCSKGQAETDKHKTVLWNQSKFRNSVAARVYIEPCKDLKSEFYLTFDLGQIAQLTEFQITFNVNIDMYNQPLGQPIKPQMVILEGKKDCMFVSSKHKSSNSVSEADSDQGVKKEGGASQTTDSGDWLQELKLISDSKDQQENLYTFGSSFCVNKNKSQMNISFKGLTRREARYIRVRLLYSEQNTYQIQQSENEMEDKGQKPSCYTINRILILGMPSKSQQMIRNLITTLQKQSTVEVLTNLFKIASKAIYQQIAKSTTMLDSFNSAYDNLLPTITKFPKAFIPAFVGIASHNEDFCDQLIQKKVLNTIMNSPRKGQASINQKDFDTLMELISGLIMIKSQRQGDRFQMILKFLIGQGELFSYGGSDTDEQLQIDFNMKLTAVFAQCAMHIVQGAKNSGDYPFITSSSNEKHIQQDLMLSFNTTDILGVISFGRMLQNPSQVRSVISLATFLINLPEPFRNDKNEVSLDQIIDQELNMKEGSSKNLLEENQSQVKSYELMLLSILLPDNQASVQRFVSFDKTLLQIVNDLRAYVQSLLKSVVRSDGSNSNADKKKSPFQINCQPTSSLTFQQALELVQLIYNFSLGGQIVQTLDQRERLVDHLYQIVTLIEAKDEQEETESVGNLPKITKYLSFVDLIPEKVVNAIVETIKMCINLRPKLQDIIATKVQRDIKRFDEMQGEIYQAEPSKFTELVVEPFLKFQDTQQVIISKLLTENENVVPFYKGMVGGSFNFSPLQSQLLTEKYSDLFYELFERQKGKSGVKQYKKEACNANWTQLSHFMADDMVYSTYAELQAKLMGQKNLLIIFEMQSNKEKMTGMYFTFGQVEQPPIDKKQDKSATPQKNTVLSQVGDFMVLGKQDTSQIAVLPSLHAVKNKHHYGHGNNNDEPTALTFQNIQKGNKNTGGSEGIIQIGSIHQNQSFLTLGFPSKKTAHRTYFQSNYIYSFEWEYPQQFQKMGENEFENLFYCEGGTQLTQVEIWQWKPECEQSQSPDDAKDKKNTKDSTDMNKVEIFGDLLVDSGRQSSKQSPFYLSMSPYNILKQNLVFNIPVGMTLEQLQVSLEIDFTLNFLQKVTGQDQIMALDKKIGELSIEQEVIELLVSDKKRTPQGMTKSNSIVFDEGSPDRNSMKFGFELPIVERLAANKGIKILVSSALIKLRCQYIDQELAEIWIDFLKLYSDFFAPLPGFESRYFKEERIDLLIKIMTKKFDGKTRNPAVAPKSKVNISVLTADFVKNNKADEEETAQIKPAGQNLDEEYDDEEVKVEVKQKTKEELKLENPEYIRQKALCEHHKKMAFETTRSMFEEELAAFEALQNDADKQQSKDFSFTKICLSQNFFACILDQLSDLTRNSARTKIVAKNKEEDWSDSETDSGFEINITEPKYDTAASKTAKDKEKKSAAAGGAGIGYSTGVGKIWDVNAYLKDKEAKNQQIIKLIEILQMLADSCGEILLPMQEPGNRLLADTDEQQVRKLCLESSLLPILEAALRSGSILEMAKEFELYNVLLTLVKTFASKQVLITLVSDIGPDYQPRQRDSLFSLLKKASEMAQIFQDCLQLQPEVLETNKADADSQEEPKKLSRKILEVYEHVSTALAQQTIEEDSKSLAQILSMPIEDAYFELCQSYRLSKSSFRKDSKPDAQYLHHYASSEQGTQMPSAKKLIRLAQEIADLTNSLPCEVTNSVYACVDKQRVDFMKCIIMGSASTPYAHGAFVYDIYFDDNYPDGPPKINLSTTGGGAIRFNPNLYSCGKVCLSLLGTWRGTATENWNPKVSTLLQVILSIQAIIMSNEVYYNEPGYEHLMGTPEGEKLNNGYSNIVRYGTLKYAIIEQLKNPTPGFEDVIRRNFFLKKDIIFAEVDGWIERASIDKANYIDGLTTSHNNELAAELGKSEETYKEKLVELRKELVTEFSKLDSPYDGCSPAALKRKTSSQAETSTTVPVKVEEKKKEEIKIDIKVDLTKKKQKAGNFMIEEQAKLDLIDVSYEPAVEESKEQKSINIEDEGVKDRWSRYIGAMGIEAVAKQAEAVVYIDQLGGLGIEIAKNIMLAGCKELILGPTIAPTYDDLASQFFIDEKDVREETKQSRATLCKQKLQELNPYVKVTLIKDSLSTNETCLLDRQVRIAIFTDPLKTGIKNEELTRWNTVLRSQGIYTIVTDQCGLFSRIITDFGQSHTVIDKDGEEIQEVMIQQMSPKSEENPSAGTLIELLTGATHNLEEGNVVTFSEVVGMKSNDVNQEHTTINQMSFKVIDVINRNSFIIDCDSSKFSAYERNGVAKQIKSKVQVKFAPLKDILGSLDGSHFDQDLQYLDFCKIENFKFASMLFKLAGVPGNSITTVGLKTIDEEEEKTRFKSLAEIFLYTFKFSIGPLCAFVGGLVAQEIVKAITGKFMPIKQEMYVDIVELFDEELLETNPDSEKTRYTSLENCFGKEFVKTIQNAKVFMIGAGAIGCELLKNFAMVGLGTGEKGQITLTDPDIIELSNLNRQFLFREKHLRKPKSMTAAAAAGQMNPDLKGHISARLDKLHKDTDHIYTEAFFKEQTVIANALDNVAARLFIDQKCIHARVPLLDSGTLGAKGHVQVIIPHKTESYGSSKDPEENNEIPHCTLKMFPEETLHCVEWAKDMLGSFFGVNPQNFNKLQSATLADIGFSNFTEVKNIEKAIKVAKCKPKYFSDCIELALNKFYKLFRDNILQLILVYPLDKLNPDGRPFWSLPKREPSPQDFNPEDSVHQSFVASYACLLANMYGVEIPYEQPRNADSKEAIAKVAALFETPVFVPNAEKAKEIQSQVEKEAKKGEDANEESKEPETAATVMIDTSGASQKTMTTEELKQLFAKTVHSDTIGQLKVEEFEKDDDKNFHVDFIHACANVRAMNYTLQPMDWITVKLKAGKIVPALATTTAAVAGLQTIELLKLLKHESLALDKFKNTFLNMAIPAMYMSEPAPPITSEIKPGLKVDTWQRWDIKVKNTRLGYIIRKLEQQFGLKARDVIYQATHLFFYALRQQDLSYYKQPQMQQTLGELLIDNFGKDLLQEQGYIDLTITFVDPDASAVETGDQAAAAAQQQEEPEAEKILEHIPTVRIILKGSNPSV